MRAAGILLLGFGILAGQAPSQVRPLTSAETGEPTPVFRVTVVSRTIKAINYHRRSGTTRIDFRGTELMPSAKGEAKVASRMGSTKIDTRVDDLEPANKFGPEFLTYVLWAITPEGRAQNLGEFALDGDNAKLLSTTELQTFGLIVTAEPYFAVTQPSEVVVMENFIRNDTTGTFQDVDARYELLKRGVYTMNRSDYPPVKIDPKGPLQLAQAENAVQIARLAGADKYAPDTFRKAELNLENARGFLASKNRKRSETNAREAAQMAEDARLITMQKLEEERVAAERAAAAAREARARAAAQEEARRRQQAEAERVAAERARRQAELAALRADKEKAEADARRAAALAQQQAARAEAEAARASALAQQQAAQAEIERERAAAQAQQQAAQAEIERERAAAEARQQAAQAEVERARLAAEEAARARQQAELERQRVESEKAELRARLQQQLNQVLETRETARGLIVNMSDVLFDLNQYTLKPGARERLAKVAGILLAYPGLDVAVEGHTDSTGSHQYNQRLSEQRAQSVRDYLAQQGVPSASVTAKGFGKTMPVATNDTAAGRQQNRRVELVVSGDLISSNFGRP
ncbi:MAG: OmpA family protein [Bryobacteraceae bacterium]|nr:OmpA family protein [Bryobacteraceae bacterium]